MNIELLVSIITITGAIIAAIIQGNITAVKLSGEFDKKMAVSETKLDALSDEVKKHNDFASRIPVIEEKIKVINHRLDDLEKHVEV